MCSAFSTISPPLFVSAMMRSPMRPRSSLIAVLTHSCGASHLNVSTHRRKCVVADAVSIELVSKPTFPANREWNRDLSEKRGVWSLWRAKYAATAVVYVHIPCSIEQGLFCQQQGASIWDQGSERGPIGFEGARSGGPNLELARRADTIGRRALGRVHAQRVLPDCAARCITYASIFPEFAGAA